MTYQRLNNSRLNLDSGIHCATEAAIANTSVKNASAKKGLKISTISQVIGENYTGDCR